MKKYLVFLLLIILVSCQKDLLEPIPDPTENMIFETLISKVYDGQDISFQIITNEQHQLIITTQDGSVITKETFTPTIGLNTRRIYIKTLPKGELILSLLNSTDELKSTSIIVE